MINKTKILEEFEKNLDANNPDGFRVSTSVEPRLADAEKVKFFLYETINQICEELETCLFEGEKISADQIAKVVNQKLKELKQ